MGSEPPRTETNRPKPEADEGLDAVEVALAQGIGEAARAQRWDVVAQLARELEARRLARATNVVALDPNRRREGGGA